MVEVSGIAGIIRVISIPNYRNYAVGNFASQIGMWVQRIAVGWLTWVLTKDPKWLGIMAFADHMPNLIFAPLGGALADRVDRLVAIKIYMVTSAIFSACIAGLTVSGSITVEWLLVLVLVNGIVMSFNFPARLSLIHGLVGQESLTTAISINAIIFNIARIGGPAIAGIVIHVWGIGPAVSITVVTDLLFVAALSFVTLSANVNRNQRWSFAEIPREIMDGFRYAARHEGIGPLLLILTLHSIFARPFIDLFPGFADDVFGRGADALALLTAALGLGSCIGSLYLARLKGVSGLTDIMVANILFMSFAVIGFVATTMFSVALICTCFAGIAMVNIGVIEQTLLQAAVDGSMRGRALSFYTLIARGCPSLGALLMGYLASFFGLRLPIACGAVLCFGMWFWAFKRRRALAKVLEVQVDER